MAKIRKYIKKHCVLYIILLLLFLAIIIPCLINAAFKSNWGISWLQAEWSAGDALGFCGAILAAIATIVGVHLSIQYAYNNSLEDEINKVKPYLALTHYRAKSKVNLLDILPRVESKAEKSDESFYEEYKVEKVFITIENDGIHFKDELTAEQDTDLHRRGIGWSTEGPGHYALRPYQLVSMPFDVENVGHGAALNTMIGFYRKGEKPLGTSVYTLKCSQKAYFHIFSNIQDDSIYGDYILELTYNDVLGHGYSQQYPIFIQKDKDSKQLSEQIDLTGKQIRTEEV